MHQCRPKSKLQPQNTTSSMYTKSYTQEDIQGEVPTLEQIKHGSRFYSASISNPSNYYKWISSPPSSHHPSSNVHFGYKNAFTPYRSKLCSDNRTPDDWWTHYRIQPVVATNTVFSTQHSQDRLPCQVSSPKCCLPCTRLEGCMQL
jgi:hypothetical protein